MKNHVKKFDEFINEGIGIFSLAKWSMKISSISNSYIKKFKKSTPTIQDLEEYAKELSDYIISQKIEDEDIRASVAGAGFETLLKTIPASTKITDDEILNLVKATGKKIKADIDL